jgi:hypothetical protein
MRNRTPTALPASKIRSPIQRTSSRDKSFFGGPGHRYHISNINVRTMMLALSLALIGFIVYARSGSDAMPAGTIPPSQTVRRVAQQAQQILDQQKEEARKAAQAHHEKDQANLQLADAAALAQKGVKPNPNVQYGKDGKLIVRDSDGDIITDDVLAKDIANGAVIDAPQLEDAELEVAEGENRWQNSETIPQWLKEYFDWHKQVTSTLSKPNWREHNYLVMTCLAGEVCGNVAHRLRPIMGMLRVAADTKRILFIHWDLPDRLEKFLHPPNRGGIDWIAPDFVMWKARRSPHVNSIPAILLQAQQEDRRVVNVMFNDNTFAEPYYDEHREDGEKAASEALKDTWDVLFKPSFILTERMTESLKIMGLEAGEYAAAHIDFELVPQTSDEQEELRLKVEHAMNCMSQLRPGGPFLVAAQTYDIAREAIVYGKQHNVKVHAKQISHDTSKVPSDLFTSFVEIELMAHARCIAFNRAGYGQLGYILGYDYTCRINYGETKDCKWTDPPPVPKEPEKVVAQKE